MEARLTSLEERMDEQERLRIVHDQELSDIFLKLKAQDGLLQSLSTTQSEHTVTLAKHTATLAKHTATLAKHTATLAKHTEMLEDHTVRLTRLEADMGHVKAGVQKIVGMLDTLIEQDGDR
ncbi:hypothetical protein [Actinoplanes regularis]|uniref:hypothetical protein n=1 Tax=Actinoplanes regularis TaxID=52697 RepID=UPI00255533FA|nr:hypothetical protein [Actinoplanes regularis]